MLARRVNGRSMGWWTAIGMAMLVAGRLAPAGEAKQPTIDRFETSVLVEGLGSPWAMVWGPDNQLWVSERSAKRLSRINPDTGEVKPVIVFEEAFPDTPHEGVLGFALAPDFLTAGNANAIYVYYIYRTAGVRHGRVVRCTYDAATQTAANPVMIIENLPAGNDHNGGRLVFGPEGKLYLSKGEMGHNQFGSAFLPIEAQRLPTAAEVAAKDWTAYVGKVLRLKPDGSIPADNPELNGVRSHVFTYGHRNPQGLAFVGNVLFSSEHGPSSDDEINRLESGCNYGWPHVAGFQDDQAYRYANYSAAADKTVTFDPNVIPAGVPVAKESDWKTPANFRAPIKTFYTVPNDYSFSDTRFAGEAAYTGWPTIAPASVAYYPADGAIPGWRHSLLVTALKNGSLYVVRLHSDGKHAQGDVQSWFHSQNRYRVAAVDPKGERVFIGTDNEGNVLGLDRLPKTRMENPGAILVFKYIAK